MVPPPRSRTCGRGWGSGGKVACRSGGCGRCWCPERSPRRRRVSGGSGELPSYVPSLNEGEGGPGGEASEGRRLTGPGSSASGGSRLSIAASVLRTSAPARRAAPPRRGTAEGRKPGPSRTKRSSGCSPRSSSARPSSRPAPGASAAEKRITCGCTEATASSSPSSGSWARWTTFQPAWRMRSVDEADQDGERQRDQHVLPEIERGRDQGQGEEGDPSLGGPGTASVPWWQGQSATVVPWGALALQS